MLEAHQLGITTAELEALVSVRNLLDSGCLKHEYDPERTNPDAFNLNIVASERGCGTVACIGGWMALSMGMSRVETMGYVVRDRSRPLSKLFFLPRGAKTDSHEAVTPAQAIVAIDNFLNTGNPSWREVLS